MSKSKFLNEALGVPDNLYETSLQIYDKILSKLKDLKSSDINGLNLVFKGKFRISDFEFSTVNVDIHFIIEPKISEPDIMSMGVETESKKTKNFRLKFIKKKSLTLSLNVVIPENYDLSNFYDLVESKKNILIVALNHELKHGYDSYKKIYDNLHRRAQYDAVVNKISGIWAVDVFFHDIYFTTLIENLVRPSEISAAIKLNQISQKEFLNFLYDNDTYKNLKRISEFTYDKFKQRLKSDIDSVSKFLSNFLENVDEMSEEEKINEMLRLIRINITNWTIQNYKSILKTDFYEELIGFSGEKEKFFRKVINRLQRFKNTDEFFKFYENQFQFVGRQMIKKIAKLYALTN